MNSERGVRSDHSFWRRAFAETADPSAYVPRAATEAVLSRFETWIDSHSRGSSIGALIASPGLGKTLLLRVLESRINGRSASAVEPASPRPRSLYLPYAGLLPTDLCDWVHGLLGLSTRSREPKEAPMSALTALLGLARNPDEPFFLLLDDADSMPQETVRVLLEGLPRERSPLRILLALNQDAKSSRLLAALDPFETFEVVLQAPMSEEETSLYLRARMRWAGLGDDAVDSLGAPDLARIHALSGGVPTRVHRIAESIFEPGEARLPSELDAKLRREDWMGRPIDDDL